MATAVSFAFLPYIGEYPAAPAFFYFWAVTAAAIYLGFSASLTALALSDILLGAFFFWRHHLYPVGTSMVLREVLFTAMAAYVCLLAHKMRLARAGEERSMRAFADFTRAAPIGFSLHRKDTTYIDINPRLAEWNGLPREEHLGRTLEEAIPGLAAVLIPHLRHVAETGESVTAEIVGDPLDPDGKPRYWTTNYFPIRSAKGEIDAIGAAVVDRTRERIAQAALGESEARYRLLTESLSQYIWTFDENGAVDYCNQHFLAFCGMTLEEVQAGRTLELLHPDDRQRLLGKITACLASGEVFEDEHRVRHASDGQYYWHFAHMEPYVGAEGKRRWLGVAIDVTARKQAELELRAAHDRLSMLLSSISESFLVLDREWRFLYANDRVLEHRGLSWGEMQGKSLWDLYPRALETEFKPGYEKVMQERVPHTFEVKYPMDDGSTRYFLVHAQPSGEGLSALVTNITERKRTEEALIRSEKLASAGRLAATIAHEINNPLEAVTNLLFLTRHVANLPDEAQQYISMATEELERVAHITRQSLGFYREPSTAQVTSLAGVLQSAIELFRGKLRRQNTAIRQEWDNDIEVEAVGGELRQVICNLFSNSLEAIRGQGEIRIRMAVCRSPDCSRWVRITIADNGLGVPCAIRPQIFEPFFTTRSATGTGLGLWVSKQLVEKHGGRIRLRSSTRAERHGTVVMILLPLPQAGG